VTGEPRPGGRRLAPLLAAALLLGALIVAACGASTVAPSASTSATASGSPRGSGPAQPQPSPTRWPGGVVEAVVILGKADLDIQAAGADLGAAAAYQDLQAMWGAADGLANLVAKLQTQVPRIATYPETSAAAEAYDAAFPDMLAGSRTLADAIKAGDAAAIQAGSKQLATGLGAYAKARRLIGPLFDQAILMQRIIEQ